MNEMIQKSRFRTGRLLTASMGLAIASMLFFNLDVAQCDTARDASQLNALSPSATNLSAVVLPMGGLKASSTNYAVNLTIGEAVVGSASGGDKRLSLGFQSVIATRTGACGDLDANGQIDITDIVYLINYLFAGGPAPKDERMGNVNCDDRTNITDAVYMVNYIFADGPVPCQACP